MTKRTMMLNGAAGLLMVLGAASASADLYTPTSEAMSDPKISMAENEQAAAIGRNDTIVVVPDEEDYAYAKPTKLALPFHIEAKVSKSKWRIKDSRIIIGIAPLHSGSQVGSCCGMLLEFSPYNYAARTEHGASQHIDRDAWWTVEVSDNSIATRARNACRVKRKELEDQGMSRKEIFAQDRMTTLPTDFRYVARVAHKSHDLQEASSSTYWKQSQPIWANINVICQKGRPSRIAVDPTPPPPPTASNDLTVGFQVNQAALAITPKHYEAKCPAKLHLNPTIEATGKGTVKYRFIDQLGNHSQTFQVKFDKSDVKFLDHVIEIDDKNKPKGLGFAAAQPQSGALGLAAPSNPNLTQGYFQVEVLSPHKKLSNIADYSVKCTVTTAGDDEITTGPADPKPVIGNLVADVKPTKKLADLVVDSVQPSPAVPTKLFVKVTNKGTAASTPTNLKALRWVGNQATARGTLVPAVLPGQSQVVLAELGGTIDGATHLYVRVDDPNRVLESDDGNNSFTVK